jgi:hypothetical protein
MAPHSGGEFGGHVRVNDGGFVIYWTNSSRSDLVTTDGGHEDHLSVEIRDRLKPGTWYADGKSLDAVYSAGRSDAKSNPDCTGVASSGFVRLTAISTTTFQVEIEVGIEILTDERPKQACESGPISLNFVAEVRNP